MKHKILIALDERSWEMNVFSDLQELLNESHKKYLTGVRLSQYLEQKLVLASGETTEDKEVSKLLTILEHSLEMEHLASQHNMEFDMFQGRLDDNALKHMSAVADLMVIDRKVLAPYCGEGILEDLVKSVYCPVLVLPEDKEIKSLLMVYDGSFSSIQTLKGFLSLFHPRLRKLPFSVLVQDPDSKKDMEQERVFIDYIKLFFDDIGVQLMSDDTVNCLVKSIETTADKPMLLFGGKAGSEIMNCNTQNRQITDGSPSFIYKGNPE
ncbi:MAG: hypothetical protein HEP71_15475 [Roseivirga sp.]|nr:hypothetical protein [Roseivirga sp.]